MSNASDWSADASDAASAASFLRFMLRIVAEVDGEGNTIGGWPVERR